MDSEFEIFLVATPGFEAELCAGVAAAGFVNPITVDGGVALRGGWPEVWRANLELRGASRVLARIDVFRALHLAQLDKRARRIAWGDVLHRDVPFRVEASCKNSRIYHSGAAAERIATAIREEHGAPFSEQAEVVIKARVEDDLCTIGVDTSGEPLHKRGYKQAVAKAPMRETLASLFLSQCGYDGTEPVVDPMCGSGTFVIEAAEIAAGLKPGRDRHFAFEHLATFDPEAWQRMRSADGGRIVAPGLRFYGSDWDEGVVRMAEANAARAGVSEITQFRPYMIDVLAAPAGPSGLVIVNPPYGGRIGDRQRLQSLYRSLGNTLKSRFSGWRVGLVTSEGPLAKATGLPFGLAGAPVSHGGLSVSLYRTGPLP